MYVHYGGPSPLIQVLRLLLETLSLLILIEVVVSWIEFAGRRSSISTHPLVLLLRRIVNPVLLPFRTLIPPARLNGMDISPLLVMMLIQFLLRSLW